MKKINKFGFTMIELLGAIVILGLLSTVAIVSVNGVLKSKNKVYYKNQEDLLKEAGRQYFIDHKSLLPKNPNESKKITLKDLINDK